MGRMRLFCWSASVCSCWKQFRTPAPASARLYRVSCGIEGVKSNTYLLHLQICRCYVCVCKVADVTKINLRTLQILLQYLVLPTSPISPLQRWWYFWILLWPDGECWYLWPAVLKNGKFLVCVHWWASHQNQRKLFYSEIKKSTGSKTGKQKEVRSIIVQKTFKGTERYGCTWTAFQGVS